MTSPASAPACRSALSFSFAALVALGCLVAGTVPASAQDTDPVYRTPAPDLAALVDAPVAPGVSLSPDRSVMLLLERPALPSIAEVSAPELRLAGVRINPRNNGPSRGTASIGMTLKALDGDERPVSGLPVEARIRNAQWSPDGRHVAFTHAENDHIELWILDVEDASARRLLEAHVNDAYFGAPYDWAPDGRSLIVRTIPEGRGDAPAESPTPTGPVIQESTGEAAPARTYQDLLENAHDEALFEHYATSQLVRVDLEGDVRLLGEPGLIRSAASSPDGHYILVQTTHRPFSYLVPASRFPTSIDVLDRDGSLVEEITDLPLQDKVPTGFGSVPTGVRSINWRADAPATLAWVEALDGGDGNVEAEERDRVFLLDAPFAGEAEAIATLGLRYGGIFWSEDNFALIYETWFATRDVRGHVVDPDDPGEMRTLFSFSMEDRYADPGFPMTRTTDRGTSVLLTTGDGQIFLSGQGASPEGNRPFLRRMNLSSGETEELFRSEAPYYEAVVAMVDEDEGKLLTRRETNDEPPNFFLRDIDDGSLDQVTAFPHPYPQLTGIHREPLQYTREDGVPLSAVLYLPAGYDASRDGPLPTFVWAYPQEFKSADAAGQRRDSPYQFTRVSYWGAVPWVTRGYAVLDNASMPVIGEGDEEPNDTFRRQLVANAQAAIEEGVRRGIVDPERVAVGGHSYGAFMTANLLAHSDLFRAGVARSGAYNRSLTPFGFQREERLFWEAPEVYFAMSPFMHADKVDEPILLIHGEADNNSGTFPIQSIRFFNAIKGLGGTARLVMLPAESHGYAARESILHMLWETDHWLETHVKSAAPRTKPVSDGGGGR